MQHVQLCKNAQCALQQFNLLFISQHLCYPTSPQSLRLFYMPSKISFLDQFCFWAVLLLQVNVQLILISNLQNVSVIFQLLRSLHRSCKYGEDEDCIGKPLLWLKSGLRISPLYLLLFAFLPFSTFTFCPNITWLRTKWFFLTVIPSQKLHNFVMARY